MSNSDLKETVKRLRLALGKSQTKFGALIGKGLATVQRYETLVPPKGKALVQLEKLASESGFDECANIFRNALRDELGLTSQRDEVPPPPGLDGFQPMRPQNPEEEAMVFDVLALMRQSPTPPVAELVRRDMKRLKLATEWPRAMREQAIRMAVTESDREKAILELHAKGQPVATIAKLFGRHETMIRETILRKRKESKGSTT
jgi:transcriptional regulator with XRE-family HTH domain